MRDRYPPELDMTPEGGFRTPRRPPLATRIGVVALVIAVLAGAAAAAALAVWFALALIPVAIIAAGVAWVAFRIQLWRLRRAAQSRRSVWQP